jgi:tetratricopeptide (TPR) repeat protein
VSLLRYAMTARRPSRDALRLAIALLWILPGVSSATLEGEGLPSGDGSSFEIAMPQPAAESARPAGVVAVSTGQEPYSSLIEDSWFGLRAGPNARGTKTREPALALGVDNLDVAARALLIPERTSNVLSDAKLAAGLAPDLPVARVALARAFWSEGEYVPAAREALEGMLAIPRNLEATFWLAGSLFTILAVVLAAASVFFMVILGISVSGRAAHDLGDLLSEQLPDFARAALLGSFLLLPLMLGEGLAGLALVCFVLAFVYGGTRYRMALVLAAALLIIGLFPLARMAGRVLDAMESDPLASAALAVTAGEETADQVALLEAAEGEEILAEYVLAVRARRGGRIEEARARYEALLEHQPENAVVLANYANLRFAEGDSRGAVDLYEHSAAVLDTDSAILMFNLSQAYARLFRIEEFEHTLSLAQSIDADAVADFSHFGDSDFVADLPFPEAEIRSRLLATANGEGLSRIARDYFAPGLLGASWLYTLGGFGGLAIVALILAGRFDRASRCERCGRRICARCDGIFWNSETCDGCHHLFHNPESTDPSMRMERLKELRLREQRRGRIANGASLLIPGAAGLLALRPGLSFVGILLFAAGATMFAWRGGVVPDPLVVGGAGTLFFVLASTAALGFYALVVLAGILIRRNS